MIARRVALAAIAGWLLAATWALGAGPATRPVRIALVSDLHVSHEARYAAYVENFRAVVAEVNVAGVDAVLVAGDLVQNAHPASFAEFGEIVKTIGPPVVVVAGNHDVGDKPRPGKPATISEKRVKAFEEAIGPAFFVRQVVPGVRVVGITSSLLDSGLDPEREQWAFLERTLASPAAGVTVVLTHYPPLVTRAEEVDEYFNMNGAVRGRLLGLLKKGGVCAVLAGHLHRPIDVEWQGVPVVVAPAVSFGLPEGKQQVGWRLVTITPEGRVSSELRYLRATTTGATTAPAGELMREVSP